MQERNYSIDTLKAICCFFVIIIHSGTYCSWANYISFITNISVPCFFMMSGYLTDIQAESILYKSRIAKLIRVIVFYLLFYLVANYAMAFISPLQPEFSFQTISIFKFVFFNDTSVFSEGHLWYISAYIYILFVFFWLSKYNLTKYAWIFSAFVIPFSITPYYVDYQPLYRNALLEGLPFFVIGMFIKSRNKIILNIITFFVVIASIFNISIGLSYLVIIVTTHFHKETKSFMSELGRKHSLNIYLWHFFVIHLLFCFDFTFKYYDHVTSLLPFIVFAISYLLSIIINKVERLF